MALNQPSLSRFHVKVYRISDDEYLVEDMNASNGTYITSTEEQLLPGEKVKVQKGAIIKLADIQLQIV